MVNSLQGYGTCGAVDYVRRRCPKYDIAGLSDSTTWSRAMVNSLQGYGTCGADHYVWRRCPKYDIDGGRQSPLGNDDQEGEKYYIGVAKVENVSGASKRRLSCDRNLIASFDAETVENTSAFTSSVSANQSGADYGLRMPRDHLLSTLPPAKRLCPALLEEFSRTESSRGRLLVSERFSDQNSPWSSPIKRAKIVPGYDDDCFSISWEQISSLSIGQGLPYKFD